MFWSTNKNNLRTYDNIRKIATVQGDDYTTGCLLDYPYFKEYYKQVAIDLSKQQKLDIDSKAIQQMNFTGNVDQVGNTQFFFHYWRNEKNSFRLFKRNSKIIIILFGFSIRLI